MADNSKHAASGLLPRNHNPANSGVLVDAVAEDPALPIQGASASVNWRPTTFPQHPPQLRWTHIKNGLFVAHGPQIPANIRTPKQFVLAVQPVEPRLSVKSDCRNTFLGAGPLIGIEGSIPFFGNWTFDYTGDAAILFGTQQSTTTTTNTFTANPAILALLFGGGGGINTATAERFGYVMSTDVQAGFGYWVTPNVKLAASYRLDAIIERSKSEKCRQ